MDNNSMVEDTTEASSREFLLSASAELDRQLTKLSALLTSAKEAVTQEDHQVVLEIANGYRDEIAHLEALLLEIEEFASNDMLMEDKMMDTDDMDNTDIILPATPITDGIDGAPRSINRFATPLRTRSAGGAVNSTPRSSVNREIDFGAFPHTPTLEQLGLSKAALDVVGGGRGRFDGPRKSALGNNHHSSSDFDSDMNLRQSIDSNTASFLTPRMTILRSSSSNFASNPGLNTHLSELSAGKPSMPDSTKPYSNQMSSTPTVMNETIQTSPFGGASSTIFGGRPSDAFTGGSEF